MIEFKKNIKKLLPYDREHYMNYFEDDFDSPIDWYGVSFLLNSKGQKHGLTEFAEIYDCLFKNIVLKLDTGSFWIVNHDDKDLAWFPNKENNLTLLRTVFKQRNVPNEFKGALVITTDDLLKLSRDLISYPSAVFNRESLFYKNLDVSNSEIPFVIKIYSDFCIDFLSTDKMFLRKIISESALYPFVVKEYRGSSIWL